MHNARARIESEDRLSIQGPLPKDDTRRKGGHSPIRVSLRESETAVPEPPKGLKQEIKDLWIRLWESPLGKMWDPDMDGPLLERYARTLHNWMNAQNDQKQLGSVITEGSQGQPVIHPITTYVNQLQSELSKMESQLGLTPMARARLGLTIAEGEYTAAQLGNMVKSKVGKQ